MGAGDEVALHTVLTWPKLSAAEAFCQGRQAGVSKRVVIAERGGSFEGGMTMTIGERGAWPVKLENDCSVRPFQEGEVMSVLESAWSQLGRSGVWAIEAMVIGHLMKTAEQVRFVPHGRGGRP